MKTQVSFKLAEWNEDPIDDKTPKLTRAKVRYTYTDGLVGEGITEYLMTYPEGADAGYVGLERFEGELDGRKGGFVFEHVGHTEGEKAVTELRVVPGSGTGDLTGLSGTGRFAMGHAETYMLEFDYQL